MNYRYLLIVFFFVCSSVAIAQHSSEILKLNRRISLDVQNQRLGQVLDQIAQKGGFRFSFSGSAFNPDSLVSVQSRNEPVRDVLDRIFQHRADYRESNNYVILRPTTLRFSIQPELIKTDQRHYLITGYVIDEQSGKR